MDTKTCPDCRRTLSVDAFGRNASRVDGLAFYCKECFRRRGQEGYERRRLAAGHELRRHVQLPEGTKRCAACREIKPIDQFHAASRGKGRHHSYCKQCRSAMARDSHLQRSYGLDREGLQRLIDGQGGVCAICRERPPEHVDHDHLTGEVRGVLCFNCNGGLGQFRDRQDVMRTAIDYLERTTWNRHRECTGVYRLTSPRPAAAPSPSSSALQHLISSRRG